ncbi:MAG: hypothetical protein HQ505_00370 [Nitrosopumilus sp.]|nr:hypothetical protein [Nitrosopumilus sp.]
MIHKKSQPQLQKRRGLSSVVGALFFTVLMIAGFSVLSLALDAQTDIVTTQRIISDIEIKKQQEQFAIFASTDENDILSVGVKNLGQNPVEISSVWIINKTLSDQPATRYSVNFDDAFVSSGFTANVLSTQTLQMIPDKYDIKIISSYGTKKIDELVVGVGSSIGALRAELITDPPDVVLGKNVTVAMIVTNTGNDEIKNVEPEMQSVTGSGYLISPSPPHTPSSVDLKQGESVMFSWDYQVNGVSGADLVFSAQAKGDFVDIDDVESNVVSDSILLREAGEGGSGGEVVISNELFGKPQLFMIMPNAVGDENGDVTDRPIWGVNVANPTDQPMFVNKVVIMVFNPRANSQDDVFVKNCEGITNGGPEKPATISPTPDNWSCPESNQLMWRDLTTPIEVAPRSVFPFLVGIGSGNMAGTTADAQNILVQPVVFTTLGQYGKAGYGTTMHTNEVALPNVFLARTPESVASADVMSELTGIVEGSTVIFNATLADMSSDDIYGISADTSLIINIPKEWTFGSVISNNGFTLSPIVTYPDGSTQIVGFLLSSIDNHNEAKTIQFTATAPSVPKAKMYVMSILANGLATGNSASGIFTVGPIAETVLQVCPTSGCP